MKRWSIWILLLLGSVFLFQACDDDDDDFTIDRQDFVTQAASGNLLEIGAGQLAVQKAVNADVRAYGQMMVTDHTQASAELASLASSKGLQVPTSLLPQHQQQLAVLTPLTGAAFDEAFVDLMVASHQEQLTLFRQASEDVDDQDLRSWAAGKVPALEVHLQQATTLQAAVSP